MRVHLESTEQIVTLLIDGNPVPARIWEGCTESGIVVHAFITRIAAPIHSDQSEFEQELQAHKTPTSDIASYPARIIL